MGIEINIDFASLWERFLAFGSQDPVTIVIQLFLGGGWIIFLILILAAFYQAWLDMRRTKFAAKWKFTVLAIDIPRNNEQTPKAVENIFASLAATHLSNNLVENYFEGKVQESFSFEIVSLEGYIQFLVRTPSQFRDLIEAAVYAQYPDAEITEVEDYAQDYAHLRFPNDRYNLWGTEFLLVKDYPYPIRTYPEFEHTLSQTFIDPMASLLEILSRLSPGEQAWLQLVITPIPQDWGEKAKKVIKELAGQTYKKPETFMDKVINAPINVLSSGVDLLASFASSSDDDDDKKKEKKKKEEKKEISPLDKSSIEGIQKKLAKIPFRVKFRLVYLGEKSIFNKGRGVAAIIGATQQFNISNGNGFKPGKKSKTSADYFRVKQRVAEKQNKILRYFIRRDNHHGDKTENMLLNIEELATIWHFPNMSVKAAMVEKIVAKKVVPPTKLPIGDRGELLRKPAGWLEMEKVISAPKPVPPNAPPTMNLPGIGDQRPVKKQPEPPANLPIV